MKVMNILRNLLYEFQYFKYVRHMPFYLVRHFGKKSHYKTKNVDYVVSKYGFNKRYSPIGYAISCQEHMYESAAKTFQPCPTLKQIRRRVGSKYFNDNEDFDFYDLMLTSAFKASSGGESGISANKEYWEYMSKFDGRY